MMGVESCGPRQLCSAQSALHEDWKCDEKRDSAGLGTRPSAGALQQAAGSQAVAELRVIAKDSVRHLHLRGEETGTRGSRGGFRTAARSGALLLLVGGGLLPSAALCLRQPRQQDVAPLHSTLPSWHPPGQSVSAENQILSLIAITIFKQTNGCWHHTRDKNPGS